MEVGNFHGKDPQRFNEERTHFGLWCMLSSPLVLGFDLNNSETMDRVWPIITNTEAIAIDHAWAVHTPLTHPPTLVVLSSQRPRLPS